MSGLPTRRVRMLLVVLVLVLGAVGLALPSGIGAGSQAEPTATFNGRSIPLTDVSRYHCHDRDFPRIRCFLSLDELETDELTSQSATSPASSALLIAFVRWFQDAGYGGSSFDAYFAYADLSTIGWNDRISSFQPRNGGHPVWWQDAGYGGVRWDWGTASVSNVGAGANDKFSSVQSW